jgi:hypothetical protein
MTTKLYGVDMHSILKFWTLDVKNGAKSKRLDPIIVFIGTSRGLT